MTATSRRSPIWIPILAWTVLAGFGPSISSAQTERGAQSRPARERPERQKQNDTKRDRKADRPERPDRPPHGPGDHPPDIPPPPPGGPLMDRILDINPFRPAPEDFGPPQPNEIEDLMDFARDRTPQLYRRLRATQDDDPGAFREQMRRIVPRLRQLKRLYDQDERLARRMIKHTEHGFILGRLSQEYRKRADRPELQRRIRARVQDLEGENLRLEIGTFGDRLRVLEKAKSRKASELADALLDPTANLIGEPPEVCDLVKRIQAAEDDEERAKLETQLREDCSERIAARLSQMRKRYEHMCDTADDEIARRIKMRFESGGPPPEGGPPPPPPRP